MTDGTVTISTAELGYGASIGECRRKLASDRGWLTNLDPRTSIQACGA
jgi:hypothetical protein